MKKERWFIFIILTLILLSYVNAEIKTNKLIYNSAESIFLTSTSDLCSIEPKPKNVKLFIVEHKDTWAEKDSLSDIRNEPSEIQNSRFSNLKIWENLKVGTYDIIIDCIDNEKYDLLEPIYKGVQVNPKKGIGTMSLGDKNINDFSWMYDSEEPDLVNEILQLKLSGKEEDIKLENLTLEFNSPNNIHNIEIYVDKNNDGILNPVDVSIGNLESSEKKITIILDYILNRDVNENLLIVFNMNEEMTSGEYYINILSLYGTGESSKEIIRFFGSPIPTVKSNTMIILNKKRCLGSLDLSLNPNPAPSNVKITARISNLTNCDEKKVSLRASDCSFILKKEINTCIIKDGFCDIEISSIKGDYYACVDKNNDKDENDFGESDFEELSIEIKEPINDDKQTISGEVIEETKDIFQNQQFSQNNPILVLLEVTLLLILFVLILILFNLRRGPKIEDKMPEKILDKKTDKKQKSNINIEKEKKIIEEDY